MIRMPDMDYTPYPGGMGKVFYTKMKSHGNSLAQIMGDTGEEDSYDSLLQRCIRTAIAMRAKGLKREDIISICSFNHLNVCVPFISALFLGIKSANFDPTISMNEAVHLLKLIRPKMLFVDQEGTKLMKDALNQAEIDSELVIFGQSDFHTNFSQFLKPSPDENSFQPLLVEDLKDTAIILFSSGTTGLPKGICLNHFSVLNQSAYIKDRGVNIERFLSYFTMHSGTTILIITSCIIGGGCHVITSMFGANRLWKLFADTKITACFMSSTAAMAMVKTGRPDNIDTTALAHLLFGGSPIPNDQVEEVRKCLRGTKVIQRYGQTETIGGLTAFDMTKTKDIELLDKKVGSCGRPLPGLSYKVVDCNTEEVLGPNQRGELRVKTPFAMNGYYKQDASHVWDSDGWMKTGDIVYYDNDLCFYVVDRVKEMLKYRSKRVSPTIIEEVLNGHPLVENGVVIGIPDALEGDLPMAVVVLKKTAPIGHVTEDEIAQWVNERVGEREKLRGGVKFVYHLPLTPSGKVKRLEIRNDILASLK